MAAVGKLLNKLAIFAVDLLSLGFGLLGPRIFIKIDQQHVFHGRCSPVPIKLPNLFLKRTTNGWSEIDNSQEKDFVLVVIDRNFLVLWKLKYWRWLNVDCRFAGWLWGLWFCVAGRGFGT
jgi:hypothetical protein